MGMRIDPRPLWERSLLEVEKYGMIMAAISAEEARSANELKQRMKAAQQGRPGS